MRAIVAHRPAAQAVPDQHPAPLRHSATRVPAEPTAGVNRTRERAGSDRVAHGSSPRDNNTCASTSHRVDVSTQCDEGMPRQPRQPRHATRRAGARAGQLAPSVRQALREEADRLEEVEDPLATIRGVGDFFAAIDHELERIAEVRLRAVGALRQQGWSYDRIAAATGLSKGRVAQLVRDQRQPAAVRAVGRVPRGSATTPED